MIFNTSVKSSKDDQCKVVFCTMYTNFNLKKAFHDWNKKKSIYKKNLPNIQRVNINIL